MPRKNKKDSLATIPDYDSSYNPDDRFARSFMVMPFMLYDPDCTAYLHLCTGMYVNMGTRHGQLIRKMSANDWLAEFSDDSSEIIRSSDIQRARITDPYNMTEFDHIFIEGQIQTIFICELSAEHSRNQESRYHEIQHYENGNLVRKSFHNQHSRCNEYDYYSQNRRVCTTFGYGHPQYNQVNHYDKNRAYHCGPVRMTFEKGHLKYREVEHYENGKLVRKTFEEGHPKYREVQYFASCHVTYHTFHIGHPHHGEVWYYTDGVLSQVNKRSQRQIHLCKTPNPQKRLPLYGDPHSSTTLADTHIFFWNDPNDFLKDDGIRNSTYRILHRHELRYFKSGKHHKTLYGDDHPMHGEVREFDSDGNVSCIRLRNGSMFTDTKRHTLGFTSSGDLSSITLPNGTEYHHDRKRKFVEVCTLE